MKKTKDFFVTAALFAAMMGSYSAVADSVKVIPNPADSTVTVTSSTGSSTEMSTLSDDQVVRMFGSMTPEEAASKQIALADSLDESAKLLADAGIQVSAEESRGRSAAAKGLREQAREKDPRPGVVHVLHRDGIVIVLATKKVGTNIGKSMEAIYARATNTEHGGARSFHDSVRDGSTDVVVVAETAGMEVAIASHQLTRSDYGPGHLVHSTGMGIDKGYHRVRDAFGKIFHHKMKQPDSAALLNDADCAQIKLETRLKNGIQCSPDAQRLTQLELAQIQSQ